MKNNDLLKQKVAEIVSSYADNLEAGENEDIDITTSMIIQNGGGYYRISIFTWN